MGAAGIIADKIDIHCCWESGVGGGGVGWGGGGGFAGSVDLQTYESEI